MSIEKERLSFSRLLYDWGSEEARIEARARLHCHGLDWYHRGGTADSWMELVQDTDVVALLGEDELDHMVQVVFFFRREW